MTTTLQTFELLSWSDRAPEAAAYLERRYDTSLFLLGNSESYGTTLADAPNSGNFRVVSRRDSREPAAVFCPFLDRLSVLLRLRP